MYFEESELSKELESLNTSKSPSFDEIHPVVLKEAKNVKALVLLFRKSWEENVVPMETDKFYCTPQIGAKKRAQNLQTNKPDVDLL